MNRIPVTVVVITKNEERNIETCLNSVLNWANEIIVVDDESSDNTVKLAQGFNAKVFHRKMDIEGRHRNWAYTQAKNEWILSLDADEALTDELKQEVDATLIHNPAFNGYSIPRRNYIGNYWIRYGGQYPAGQLRLFKKDKFKYEEADVHPRGFLEGPAGHLTKDMIHKSYRDFTHFLAKLNGQTTLEAKKWYESGRKMTFGKTMWRTLDRFPRAYIRKKGYKDGFIGFMVAFFASLYQIISYAKYWEMKNKETLNAKA